MTRRLWAAAVAATALAATLLLPRAADAQDLAAEGEFLWRINLVRGRVGAPALALDDRLNAAARVWASSMAARSTLEHNPNLRGITADWRRLGENVGSGFDVPQLEQAFEQSPHHYENLVNPAFTLVGIGVVVEQGVMWVTEDFMQPMVSPTPPSRGAVVRPASAANAPAPATPPPPPPPPPAKPVPQRPLEFANAALERRGAKGLAAGLSGWGASRFAVVRSPARTGGLAQRVEVAKNRAGGAWYELQAAPGQTYRQRARVAVRSLNKGARVEMILEWYDAGGKLVGYRLRPLRHTSKGLLLRSQAATAPAGASSLRAVLNVKGGGTFVMDDVSVCRMASP